MSQSMGQFAANLDIEAHQAKVRAGRRPKSHGVDCFCVECAPMMTPTEKPKRSRKSITSEHDHQCALIAWADAQARLGLLPGIHLLFAIPNGGKRSKGVAGKLRAEGVKAGVADLFAPCARRGYNGIFVELKSVGGKVSELQRSFIESVTSEGYFAKVCYGASEAINLLEWYFEKNCE